MNYLLQRFFLLLTGILAASILGTSTVDAKHEAREITTMNQFREIMSSKKPTIILFYAPWCGACKTMIEPFNTVSAQFDRQAHIVKINADGDQFKEVVDLFGIEGVPTIVIKSLGALKNDTLLTLAKTLIGPELPSKKPNPNKKPNPVTQKAPKKPTAQKKSSKKPKSPQITRKK